jgi:DNA invertase Pin-like site-specific DNA recombinase
MGDPSGRWLRVSTGGQSEDNQVPDVTAWEESHGYEMRKTYTLHGKSASKGEQQAALDEMLADMHKGLIKVLVVWRDDRIERRGVMHMIPLLNAVREAGGRIEFTSQPHLNDLTTMAGRISLAVMSEVSHAESETKSERIRIAHDTIAANGAFRGRPPFGYVSRGVKYSKKLVTTSDGEKYIPEMYARVIAGESLDTIAAWLGSELGRRVWARTIAGYVRNAAYRGEIQDAEGRMVYACPELVNAAVWAKAVASLDSRPSSKRQTGLTHTRRGKKDTRDWTPETQGKAMLASVLYCPSCGGGSPMYRIRASNTRKDGTHTYAYYYRCTGTGPQRKGCGNMLPLADADALASKAMGALDEPVMRRDFIPGHNHDAEIQAVAYKLRQLPLQGLDEDTEDQRRSELRAERKRLENLPVVADDWQDVNTGVTYAGMWRDMDVSQRGHWLRARKIRMYASKDDSVVPALLARIAENATEDTAHRYAVEYDGTITLVVYFGTALDA